MEVKLHMMKVLIELPECMCILVQLCMLKNIHHLTKCCHHHRLHLDWANHYHKVHSQMEHKQKEILYKYIHFQLCIAYHIHHLRAYFYHHTVLHFQLHRYHKQGFVVEPHKLHY